MKKIHHFIIAFAVISTLASCSSQGEDLSRTNSARLCKLAHNCYYENIRQEAKSELRRRGINPESLECSKIAEDAKD